MAQRGGLSGVSGSHSCPAGKGGPLPSSRGTPAGRHPSLARLLRWTSRGHPWRPGTSVVTELRRLRRSCLRGPGLASAAPAFHSWESPSKTQTGEGFSPPFYLTERPYPSGNAVQELPAVDLAVLRPTPVSHTALHVAVRKGSPHPRLPLNLGLMCAQLTASSWSYAQT